MSRMERALVHHHRSRATPEDHTTYLLKLELASHWCQADFLDWTLLKCRCLHGSVRTGEILSERSRHSESIAGPSLERSLGRCWRTLSLRPLFRSVPGRYIFMIFREADRWRLCGGLRWRRSRVIWARAPLPRRPKTMGIFPRKPTKLGRESWPLPMAPLRTSQVSWR